MGRDGSDLSRWSQRGGRSIGAWQCDVGRVGAKRVELQGFCCSELNCRAAADKIKGGPGKEAL